MDGVLEGNDERQRTRCKQVEPRSKTRLSRKSEAARCKKNQNGGCSWEEKIKFILKGVIINVKLKTSVVIQHSNITSMI